MIALVKRLHILVGLFSLTAIIVFGLTGIIMTFPPSDRIVDVQLMAYQAPGDLSDKDVADDLYRILKPPLSGPIPAWAVHRNAEHALVLVFYSPNGVTNVTVLEADKMVKIERRRSSLGQFIDAMHGTSFYGSPPHLRLRLWALYIDCSIFSLLFMSVTGPLLWLTSRPRVWWAQAAFAAGTGLFAGLWFVTR